MINVILSTQFLLSIFVDDVFSALPIELQEPFPFTQKLIHLSKNQTLISPVGFEPTSLPHEENYSTVSLTASCLTLRQRNSFYETSTTAKWERLDSHQRRLALQASALLTELRSLIFISSSY